MYGVFLEIFVTSSSVNLIPASFAIAGRCKAAFVDPPDAATTTAAFSSDFFVTISLGLIFFLSNS